MHISFYRFCSQLTRNILLALLRGFLMQKDMGDLRGWLLPRLCPMYRHIHATVDLFCLPCCCL